MLSACDQVNRSGYPQSSTNFWDTVVWRFCVPCISVACGSGHDITGGPPTSVLLVQSLQIVGSTSMHCTRHYRRVFPSMQQATTEFQSGRVCSCFSFVIYVHSEHSYPIDFLLSKCQTSFALTILSIPSLNKDFDQQRHTQWRTVLLS